MFLCLLFLNDPMVADNQASTFDLHSAPTMMLITIHEGVGSIHCEAEQACGVIQISFKRHTYYQPCF